MVKVVACEEEPRGAEVVIPAHRELQAVIGVPGSGRRPKVRVNGREKGQRAALKFAGERGVAFSARLILNRPRHRLVDVPGILSGEREARESGRTPGDRVIHLGLTGREPHGRAGIRAVPRSDRADLRTHDAPGGDLAHRGAHTAETKAPVVSVEVQRRFTVEEMLVILLLHTAVERELVFQNHFNLSAVRQLLRRVDADAGPAVRAGIHGNGVRGTVTRGLEILVRDRGVRYAIDRHFSLGLKSERAEQCRGNKTLLHFFLYPMVVLLGAAAVF